MILQYNRLSLLLNTYSKFQAIRRISNSVVNYKETDLTKTNEDIKEPIKFTTSEAYLNYKAIHNFKGDDRDLPASHNYFIAGTGILGCLYLIYLRDDIEDDGGKNLFKPVHESIPELAIPMLKSAIAENRKAGYDTRKLEKKLAQLMLEPEKYGMKKKKLVEN